MGLVQRDDEPIELPGAVTQGTGPRAVGDSTTRSVVSSILLIILADAVFAAVTYNLRK